LAVVGLLMDNKRDIILIMLLGIFRGIAIGLNLK